jgi:hypothetical protein
MAPAVPPACPRCAGSIPASGNRASSPDAATSRANWSSSELAERRPVSSSGSAKPWKQSPVHLRRRGWVDPSAPAIVVAWLVPRLQRGGRQPPRQAFLPAARGSREWLLREGDDSSVHAWGQPCPNSLVHSAREGDGRLTSAQIQGSRSAGGAAQSARVLRTGKGKDLCQTP